MSLSAALTDVRILRTLPRPELRRKIREDAGVSQAAIAGELGVAVSAVSRWERGLRTPRRELLRRYCEILEQLSVETATAASHVQSVVMPHGEVTPRIDERLTQDEDPASAPGLAKKPARHGRQDPA